jgi:hypothetical protein
MNKSVDLDFIEKHLKGGPFEVVLTLLALLGALAAALPVGSWIGARVARAWADVFGPARWLADRGQDLASFGRGVGVLTTLILYIGVVIGAVS